MGALRIMRQADDLAPPAIVNQLFNDEFYSKLKMQPIPILLVDFKHEETGYEGRCDDLSNAIENEVRIRYEITKRERMLSEEKRRVELTAIYIHECAHRLTNHGHYGSFLALNLFLLLRLEDDELIRRFIRIYEFHQEAYHPADTLRFSWDIAHELAPTDITAEEATKIILDKYKAWCKWMDGAEAREQDAQTREIGTRALISKLQAGRKSMAAEINSLKMQCWHFFACGVFFTAVVNHFTN